MRQWVYLFFFCLLIIICKNKAANKDVLPSFQMQEVLSDLMKADQFVTYFVAQSDTGIDKDVESIKLYQQIFDLHGITKLQFEESLFYYQTHPDLLKVIMDSISKQVVREPVQTTPAIDTTLKKDSVQMVKDSIPISRDSLINRRKKAFQKNN